MCDVGRRIWQKGFCAGNEGNHSYRIGENRILCTPTGISKSALKPDDICTVDLEGKQISGTRKRTSEINLHLAIYKARPDVKAVIHCIHRTPPPSPSPVSICQPASIPRRSFSRRGGRPPNTSLPANQRLGESILPYVKDSNTILLQSHGVVCFHPDLEQAYYQLEIVDRLRADSSARQTSRLHPAPSTRPK